MDYHEWTPQNPPPRDRRSEWTNGAVGPESRPNEPDPATGSGHGRPRYSEQDYGGHGYWDEQQRQQTRLPDRRYVAGSTGLRPSGAASGPDHTDSWRIGAAPVRPLAPPAAIQGSFDDERDYPAVLWWTGIWYAGPIVLYTLLALLISTSAMRSHATHALLGDSLAALFAIALSLGVATGIRRMTLAWRAITVGFGAAVIGAGIATLLISAF